MKQPIPVHHTPRRRAGFLLNELLVALGIFAIGMAALASLFPVAAILQRETAQDVFSSAAAQSARSIVQARPLTYDTTNPSQGDLGGYHALAGRNKRNAVPLAQIDPNLLTRTFPPATRSYPTASVDGTDISNCDLFWVPFVQDLNGKPEGSGQNWVMRVFILERDSRATYPQGGANKANPDDPPSFPKVVSVGCSVADNNTFSISGSHAIRSGGVMMDNNGIVYTVTEVDNNQVSVAQRITNAPTRPNTLWYAPPYEGSSNPARAVETISINVEPHNP